MRFTSYHRFITVSLLLRPLTDTVVAISNRVSYVIPICFLSMCAEQTVQLIQLFWTNPFDVDGGVHIEAEGLIESIIRDKVYAWD